MTIEFDGQNNKLGTTTADSVTIKTNDTDALTVDSSQNVGVGGTSTVGGGATNGQILFSIPTGNRALTIKTVSDGAEFDVGTTNTNLGKDLIFSSGGTEVARFTSAGLAIGGTGSANTLDDYEEGTWTPVLSDASSGGNNPASITNLGAYTKIGRMVRATFVLQNIDTTGMTSGNNLYVQGLPFTTSSSSPANISESATKCDNITFTNYVIANTGISDSYFGFRDIRSSNSDQPLLVSAVDGASSDIISSVTYFTDS